MDGTLFLNHPNLSLTGSTLPQTSHLFDDYILFWFNRASTAINNARENLLLTHTIVLRCTHRSQYDMILTVPQYLTFYLYEMAANLLSAGKKKLMYFPPTSTGLISHFTLFKCSSI